jgi:sodium-dependent dicarboxylate transporter 2/3/5
MKAATKTVIIGVSLALLAFACALSSFFGEDAPQCRAAGLLATSLLLWLTEALPMSVATLMMVCVLPFTGLMSMHEAISNFGTNTALFIMASSGITVALSQSTVPRYVTMHIFAKEKRGAFSLLFLLGIVVTLFSALMSSLATCVLFAGLVLSVLREGTDRPKETSFGRAAMLIIPACAGIGGFMTPAGTPANILVMELMSDAGTPITFAQWCLVGIPVGLMASMLFIASAYIVLKPTMDLKVPSATQCRLSRRDALILGIIAAVVFGWFSSSFFDFLTTTQIALLGLALMMTPSLRLMSFKDFAQGVNWDLVLTMGSVSILMTAVANSGLVETVAAAVFGMISVLSPDLMLIAVSLMICLFRAFVPTTTAVVALFAPMLISFSGLSGISTVALLLLLAFWAASALLLVFTEPIYLITYREGFYTELDLLKAGVPVSIAMAVIAGFAIPALVSMWVL